MVRGALTTLTRALLPEWHFCVISSPEVMLVILVRFQGWLIVCRKGFSRPPPPPHSLHYQQTSITTYSPSANISNEKPALRKQKNITGVQQKKLLLLKLQGENSEFSFVIVDEMQVTNCKLHKQKTLFHSTISWENVRCFSCRKMEMPSLLYEKKCSRSFSHPLLLLHLHFPSVYYNILSHILFYFSLKTEEI